MGNMGNGSSMLKGMFQTGYMVKNMPFLYFLGLLCLVYIANAHHTEKKLRLIHKMKEDLKEIRWQYMSQKSELMYSSTYTQIAKSLESEDLQVAGKLPKKVKI